MSPQPPKPCLLVVPTRFFQHTRGTVGLGWGSGLEFDVRGMGHIGLNIPGIMHTRAVALIQGVQTQGSV